MGTVYLAEQTEPIRRRVAIKLIKLGMDTREVIARFQSERQALALMNHPNVAKILDAGTTQSGRPYFVMDYVRGSPITDHCDRHRVSGEDRLDLFMHVCTAVQHAHQRGIIHRDLKPSNILVEYADGKAIPKVIDFGVAKATDHRMTEKTLFTEQGMMIGTPAYMSPEQAGLSAQDIDTRSDIYSLGVLLYELLMGRLPFDPDTMRGAGLAEIQRIIQEEEPRKPSTRVSTSNDETPASADTPAPDSVSASMKTADATVLAASKASPSSVADITERRRCDPRTLHRRLRSDLDWIVMKCLEKDRSRRYESATGLAEDIQHQLKNEPVVAGPPRVGYRVSKFVRRNRTGVAAAGVLLVVLLAGITGTTWGFLTAVNARDAEREAKEQTQTALKLAEEREQQAQASLTLAQQREAEAHMARRRADEFLQN